MLSLFSFCPIASLTNYYFGKYSVGDILYGDSGVLCSQSRFSDFYNKAMSLDTGRMQLNLQLPEKLPGDMKCKEATLFFSQLKLRQARCLLQSMTVRVVNENSENLIKSLCEDVAGSALSSSTDRVWAYFHLGTLRLIEARRSGALLRLWQENSATEATDDYSLRGAKSNFLDAARFNTMGSNILSRNILRNLALVSGPEHCKISGLSAGILVLASIGRSSREFTLRSLNETIGTMAETSTKDVREAFTSFDADFSDLHRRDRMVVDFLERFAKVSPKKWKFAAPVICSSGEVLLTSIEKSSPDGNFKMRTSCLFPDGCTKNAYDDIMKPLDEIIGRSQKQLHGMDHATVTEHFSKESAKRKWWDNRNQLDTELRNLVERVESKYFPTLHLRTSSTEIGGSAHHSIFEDDDSAGFPCGNLASKFEAACEPSDDSESPDESYTEESLNKLTVPKLKARLLNYGLSETQTRKLRKYELIDMLIKEQRNERDKLNDSPSTSDSVKGCLFLILDENLHRFPFEGMPSLVNRAVCRVPSLQLVFATLLERRSHTPLVDPFNISYVLDPENNLPETRRRLLPELESMSSNQNWEWNGTVGKIPSGEVFETCLEKDNGMMMYFGHGGAKCCFSRRQVDGMACKKRGSTSKIDSPAVRSCKSSVILMGCSSGRLISVNRKDSDSLEQIPLHYEPEGIALSYLCAGAPCVVGNIWDVTDHDIDR